MTRDSRTATSGLATLAWASSRYALRLAWKWAPGAAALLLLLTLLSATVPAAQVVLVRWLSASVSNSDDVGIFVAVALLSLSIGASRALIDSAMTIGQVLTKRLEAGFEALLLDAVAAQRPRDLVDPHLVASVRDARETIGQHVATHADAAISACKSVITAALLFASLATIDIVAAALVVASLVPTLVAFALVSRLEAPVWPLLGQRRAAARYLGDQLLYERTAVDLALLDASPWIARRARTELNRYTGMFGAMMSKSGAIIAGSGIATAVFVAGALLVLAGSTDGSVASISAGVVAVISGVVATADAGFTTGMVLSGTRSVHRFRELVSGTNLAAASPSTEPQDSVRELVVDGLTVRYPSGAVGCANVSFSARRGQIVALVGPNGAGKSSVLHAISGLFLPAAGSIEFDGRSAVDSRLCGVLSQDFGRYELTVREAVSLGSEHSLNDDLKIWDALELAEAAGFVSDLPSGLETRLGQQWGGVNLSGGQWQRLALARVALRDSSVWLLDEPTSAIDAEAEERIIDRLRARAQQHIMVLVTHRSSTLRAVDRILMLEQGTVVEDGTFRTLLEQNGKFAALFRSQTRVP